MQLAGKKTLVFVICFYCDKPGKRKERKKITSSMWLEYKMDFLKKCSIHWYWRHYKCTDPNWSECFEYKRIQQKKFNTNCVAF